MREYIPMSHPINIMKNLHFCCVSKHPHALIIDVNTNYVCNSGAMNTG